MSSSLPRGWCVAGLSDVAEINPPGPATPVADDAVVSFVPMAAAEAMTGRLDPSATRMWAEVKKGYTRFQEGDVLLAKITPCMENGKFVLARGLTAGVGAGTTEFHVVRPHDGIEGKYVLYYALQDSFRRRARSRMTGTAGQLRVPAAFLEDEKIPLAPASEQRRIVEAVESCVSRVDAAVASLERAQAKLKSYRASVVKAAVEGRLVPTEAELARTERRDYEPADVLLKRILAQRRRRSEESELAKLKAERKAPNDGHWNAKSGERKAPSPAHLPSLPEGWCWVRLDQISDVQLGQQRSPLHAQALDQVPYIRAANVTWDGLDLTDVKTMGFPNVDRYRLELGDVLLSEASGSPMEAGKPAIWHNEIPGACYQKTLLRIRVADRRLVLPEYLRIVFLRDCVVGKFARLAPGVGIVHLTAERMLPWAIPLAPVAEQRRIVDEVDRLESTRSAVWAAVARDKRRCARLRQGILKSAFEGKLVDQDPNDESATSLLQRFPSERAASGGAKSRRGKFKAAR